MMIGISFYFFKIIFVALVPSIEDFENVILVKVDTILINILPIKVYTCANIVL